MTQHIREVQTLLQLAMTLMNRLQVAQCEEEKAQKIYDCIEQASSLLVD